MAIESCAAVNVHPEGAQIPLLPFPIVRTDPGLGVWARLVFQFNNAGSGSATFVLPITAGVNIGPSELKFPAQVDCCAHALAPVRIINKKNFIVLS
jgi:hypothetical protein